MIEWLTHQWSQFTVGHLLALVLMVVIYTFALGYCMWQLSKSRAQALIEDAKAREEAIRAANTKVAHERRIRPRTPLKPSYPPSLNDSTENQP